MYKNVELNFLLNINFLGAERGDKVSIQRRKRSRDRIGIVVEILEMARDGMLKTNIMCGAGISYFMLKGYLGLMMDARLLDRVLLKNKIVFKTTYRGIKLLYHCYEIMELLETEDAKHKPFRRIQLLPSSLSSRPLHRVLTYSMRHASGPLHKQEISDSLLE
jgi:predicted transcriptional regulator